VLLPQAAAVAPAALRPTSACRMHRLGHSFRTLVHTTAHTAHTSAPQYLVTQPTMTYQTSSLLSHFPAHSRIALFALQYDISSFLCLGCRGSQLAASQQCLRCMYKRHRPLMLCVSAMGMLAVSLVSGLAMCFHSGWCTSVPGLFCQNNANVLALCWDTGTPAPPLLVEVDRSRTFDRSTNATVVSRSREKQRNHQPLDCADCVLSPHRHSRYVKPFWQGGARCCSQCQCFHNAESKGRNAMQKKSIHSSNGRSSHALLGWRATVPPAAPGPAVGRAAPGCAQGPGLQPR